MAELPVRKRVFYGMAGLCMNLPDLIFMQWIVYRYVRPGGQPLASAVVIGVIITFARVVIEGPSCMVVAHWSDQCTLRQGRRLPFMRYGIVPFVLVFFLMFMPPFGHNHWANEVHAGIFIPLYLILYGLVFTPYLALIPEITSNLKERIDLTTFQSVFMLLASILFALVGVMINLWGWTVVMGAAAALIFLFFLPCATRIHERPRPAVAENEDLAFFHSVFLTLKNKPFRYVVAATALFWFGLNGLIALIPFWVVSYLGRSEGDVTNLMGLFLIVNMLFFFVFNGLAPKLGKHMLMLATLLGSAIVLAAMCLVGLLPFGSDYLQTAFIVALFGAPVAGFMVLPFAILGDVVDYDERLTGRRREAIFFGVQGIFQKIMIGVSVFTFTIVPFLGDDGTYRLREDGWVSISGRYTPNGGAAVEADNKTKQGAPWVWVLGEETVAAEAEGEEVKMAALAIRVDVVPNHVVAPWTLRGPDGFVREGAGDETLTELAPGRYSLSWGEVADWSEPESARIPTAFGLKLMALLSGLFCLAAFVVFLGYPIRDHGGKITLKGEDA